MISKTDELIIKLASTPTGETLFNPYNQICKNYDISTAPGIRQGNLRMYLNAFDGHKIENIWVFNVADYFSTKITGIPKLEPIDYAQLETILGLPEHFEPTHRNGTLTAFQKPHTSILDTMLKQDTKPLVWHVIPFYPHTIANINASRAATRDEYLKYGEFMHLFIDIFRPKTIFAAGNETKTALDILNIKSKLQFINP